MGLRFLAIVDESGTLIDQHPVDFMRHGLLVGGFIRTLEALGKLSGLETITLISGHNFIGMIRELREKCRCLAIFDIPPKLRRAEFLEPIVGLIVRTLNDALRDIRVTPGLVDGNIISVIRPTLRLIFDAVNKILAEVSEIDASFRVAIDSYGGSEYIDEAICGGLAEYVSMEKDGLYLLKIPSIGAVIDILETLKSRISRITSDIKPASLEADRALGLALRDLLRILGDDLDGLIASLLLCRHIIVFCHPRFRESIMAACAALSPLPYVCTENLNLFLRCRAPSVLLARHREPSLEIIPNVSVIDLRRGEVINAPDLSISRRIGDLIRRSVARNEAPEDLSRHVRKILDDIRVTINLVCDVSESNIAPSYQEILTDILSRYDDVDIVRVVFRAAAKLLPGLRAKIYELYRQCVRRLFPLATLVE